MRKQRTTMSEPKNRPEPESSDAPEFNDEAGHHDWWQDILDIFKDADFVPGRAYVRDSDDAPWREVDISDEESEASPNTPSSENEAED
jgi:hypothetical protein